MTPREQQRNNRVVWFEIPAEDLDRATHFYEQVLDTTLRREQAGPETIAIFTYDLPYVGGCLVKSGPSRQPAAHGSIVYLTAGPRLDDTLARVQNNGGAIVTPKTALPAGMGFYANIRDTEGNTVGLHALS